MPSPSGYSGFIDLLDVDPELGWRLREDDRLEAREYLRLPLTVVPVGSWALAMQDQHFRPFGMMVVDGVLLQEVQVGGRHALQVLGPGDIVLPNASVSEVLDVQMQWMAAVESQIAVLDERLQTPFGLWPGLALAVVERAGQQLARASVQAAIAQLPRVDQRLEATFWQLADRWGRVTPSGIHIPLTLTHEVLARLVGGRRPTITLALTELADRGVLVRRPDRTWLIIARDSTLPLNSGDDAIPKLELRAQADDRAQAAMETRWSAQAGRELVAEVRQQRQTFAARRERLRQDLARYAEVRDRSRELRDEILRRRSDQSVEPR
jgi:hypothetical protein